MALYSTQIIGGTDQWTHASGIPAPAADWGNPSNLRFSDGNSTTSGLQSGNVINTYYLLQATYGFSIPASVTVIRGIKLDLRADIQNFGAATSCTGSAWLLKNLNVVSVLKTNFFASSGGFATYTYGASSDLWNVSWTRNEINSPGFGIRLQFNSPSPFNVPMSILLDYAALTVYYEGPSPTSVTRDIRTRGKRDSTTNRSIQLTGVAPSRVQDVHLQGKDTTNVVREIWIECTVKTTLVDCDLRISARGTTALYRNIRLVGATPGNNTTRDVHVTGFGTGASRDNDLRIFGVFSPFTERTLKMFSAVLSSSRTNDLYVTGTGTPTERDVRIEGIFSDATTRDLIVSGVATTEASRAIILVGRSGNVNEWFKSWELVLRGRRFRIPAEGFRHRRAT